MSGYNVVVADKWDKSVGVEMCSEGVYYSAPVEFGSINSNGVIYDVKVLYPKYNKAENAYIILTRRESLEIAGAEKILAISILYMNNKNARKRCFIMLSGVLAFQLIPL